MEGPLTGTQHLLSSISYSPHTKVELIEEITPSFIMANRPQDIGIKAIEIYFPSQVCSDSQLATASATSNLALTESLQCVDQAELEKFDGASQGKYTIGLGQTKMSFCDDREGDRR